MCEKKVKLIDVIDTAFQNTFFHIIIGSESSNSL